MSLRRVGLAFELLFLATTTTIVPIAIGSGAVGSAVGATSTAANPPSENPAVVVADNRQSVVTDPVCPRPTDSESAVSEPRIVELYPNPTTHGNVGEFLVLDVPPETNLENWTLTDGHTTARLPNETASGRLAVTTAPERTRELTDERIVELEGTLRLAVDGDDLKLRNGSATVDAISYDRAPTAERWYRHDSGSSDDRGGERGRGEWWPRDATCRPVLTADVDDATTFVLPDAPDVPRDAIRAADDRLLLAGYTVTDETIAGELVAAADRGADVAVLLEGSPVGGTPTATESVLETLERGGVDVRVVGGQDARYRFHHPKYAVADDAVVVTTENWKPSGVGGESSRGWGLYVENEALADELATVFRADFDGWDTESGAAFRANASFVDDDPTPRNRAFPTVHDPATVAVDSAELLLAPDNAEPRLQDLLDDANEEILIKQASIDADVSLLEAAVDAARRDVDVRILLDSTWYVEDENEALAADLERTANREDLSLEARVVDETDEFEKIHAKGIVIDRETVIVGSANWNENSLRNNREVLVVLHGSDAAAYYAGVFESDWEGDAWSLPIELSITVIVALGCAALVGYRYVRFGTE